MTIQMTPSRKTSYQGGHSLVKLEHLLNASELVIAAQEEELVRTKQFLCKQIADNLKDETSVRDPVTTRCQGDDRLTSIPSDPLST